VPELRYHLEQSNEEIEKSLESEAKKQTLGLMNKAPMLANKQARVNDEEEGGFGGEFDPITILTNATKQKVVVMQVGEPPVEDVLMARTLWPE